jgi:exopolyphosphatase/pppGpp-phosphohydrolase
VSEWMKPTDAERRETLVAAARPVLMEALDELTGKALRRAFRALREGTLTGDAALGILTELKAHEDLRTQFNLKEPTGE